MAKLHSVLSYLFVGLLLVGIVVMLEMAIPVFTSMFNTIYGVGR